MKNLDKKTAIFSIIVLIGLVLSVYLVLNYQTILSRAGSNDYTNFTVTQTNNGQDTPVTCDSNGSCETQSLDVKLQIKDLEKLSE